MRLRKWILVVTAAVLAAAAGGSAANAPDAMADDPALVTALRALAMSPHDLEFKKDVVESGFILPVNRQFLRDPLALPAAAAAWDHRLSHATSIAEMSEFAAGLITAPDGQLRRAARRACPPYSTGVNLTPVDFHAVPATLRPIVERLYLASCRAAAELERALPPGPLRQRALAALAFEPLQLRGDPGELDRWQQLGLDTTPARELLRRQAALELQDDEPVDGLLAAAAHFAPGRLATAVVELARAVDEVVGQLQAVPPRTVTDLRLDTPLGPLFIGGAGPNRYDTEAWLIIDSGGDDTYANSAGGANGLLGRPVSIVIDLAGNDRYTTANSFAQGSGVFGIGILVDCAGNDTYEAKHVAQGAGFFGAGLLVDGGGNDSFTGDTLCQGAAIAGVGVLLEGERPREPWSRYRRSARGAARPPDNMVTHYTAAYCAQAFGGPLGCGLLIDAAGDDVYQAGGKHPCSWIPGHFFALAQGFGYGWRPFAGGGIGVLFDQAGDDRYEADVYGQGASYWYAAGVLIDGAGNDRYDARQYCQGAGIHLSSGLLVDHAGDDRYAAQAICQGGAHDYSVGLLLDDAGNDSYQGVSTAQGAAINNSFALLRDAAGNDVYVGTDTNQSQAAGHDGGKREYGSIALLLDLGGTDSYSQGQTNNSLWLKPWYGAGLDIEQPDGCTGTDTRPPPHPVSRSRGTPASPAAGRGAVATRLGRVRGETNRYAAVDPHHPIERLLRRALSDNPADDAKAADAELQRLGPIALAYLTGRVDSPDVSVRVRIEALVDQLGTNAVPVLIDGIRTARNDEQARICAYFLARFESATNAIPAVLPLLRRDKTVTTALYTLGHLRAAAAFGPALRALRDPRELVRLRAAQALGRIGDARAVPRLIAALDDEFWSVRYAAQDALVRLGAPARAALRRHWPAAPARARPHLLRALAQLGDPDALTWARGEYRDDDPLVRAAALGEIQSLQAAGHR